MDKYYETEFETIIKSKTKIYNDDITIKCQNMNGIVTYFEGKAIDIFIDEIKNNNALLKNSKFFTSVLLDEKKVSNKEKFNEAEYFYRIYLNCIPYSNKLKDENNETLKKICKEKSEERFLFLEPNVDKLKSIFKSTKKINIDTLYLIDKILSDIGILIRTDFIKYIQAIKKSMIIGNKVDKKDMYIYHIMSSIVSYLEHNNIFNYIFDNHDFQDINMISHSNRVSLMMIEFMLYYNKEFKNRLGNKLRLEYKNKYIDKYKKIISHFENDIPIDNLERVFKFGIRKFSTTEIINFSIGALYHDIGLLKIFDSVPMNNFLKDTDNNQDLHALKGYNFIKKTLNFQDDVSLLVGLHHDYYGYSKNNLIKQFLNNKYPDNILSFEAEDFIKGEVYAYVPSKILEIIDIFDVLLFMNSRKKENIEDVIIYIKDKLMADEIKLDPIILDLFINYLSETYEIKLNITTN
ncbi:phosphohydrolase [Brachyspira pilosicoli]|uniref:HD domain-containing protein n=1 Tax=Brachyspira pilosicoli TaxID=52584 RepID=UPI0012F48361|nr:HD domain-containing protein [Brachyspira pilosicoli]